MHHFILAAIGGAMIGIAAVVMMGLNGRIAGISGILSGVFSQPGNEKLWRVLFVVGLVVGGALPGLLFSLPAPPVPDATIGLVIAGGLFVGIGTGLGSGCTSGHGICGMARLSKRSIVATVIFMATGVVAVYILRHLIGG